MICDSLLLIDTKGIKGTVPVPCGKCPNCKKRRVDEWVFRMMEEDKISSSSYFITLTYNTDTVPISKNGFMTLSKKDYQDYMKRLRKLNKTTLKYYAVGEYGTKNKRPHYHAIIFNIEDKETIFKAWQNKGTVHVGQVSGDSIAYTMKYIDKITNKKQHARDDRQPEFPLMSKGIGKNYITEQTKNWHKSDLSRMFVVRPGGHKVSMPRYYKNQIFTDHERDIQIRLANDARHETENRMANKFDNTWGKYTKHPSFDFTRWISLQKLERHDKFYRSIKSRSL